MAVHKKPKIEQIQWLSHHDAMLSVSAGDDLEIIKSQVVGGVAKLWECKGEKHSMLVVTRVDPGPELCIVLGEGSGMMEFAPYFLTVAKSKGMSVRTHVTRDGLVKMWNKLGLKVEEKILRLRNG